MIILNIEIIRAIIYKVNASINDDILDKQKLINDFKEEISDLKNDNKVI